MQSQARLPRGKMLLDPEEQVIIKVAFKLNKTLTELEKEPLNYVLSMYHKMQFDEQMKLASDLLQHFTSQQNTKK